MLFESFFGLIFQIIHSIIIPFFLKQNMKVSEIQNIQSRIAPTLKKSKSSNQFEMYEEKLSSAIEMNAKLKQLYQTIKNNNLSKKIEMNQSSEGISDNQITERLKKKQGKLHTQIQHLTNNLNVLTSQNAQLKAQVDNSRNSRVIYSNVYKTIQKEIRKHEYLYKLAIIDYLSYHEVENKVEDKIKKTLHKLEKDINELEGKSIKKKQKRKSRLDTGLSSHHRLESKDTYRQSNDDDLSNNLITKREDIIQELNSKKYISKRCSKQNNQETIKEKQKEKTNFRSKGMIILQKVEDYYQFEMKSNYYDNVIKHLKEITGHQNFHDIQKDWESIDQSVENEYKTYLGLEERNKAYQEEIERLQKEFRPKEVKEQPIPKTEEELELQKINEELTNEKRSMTEKQQDLTKIMDINCHRLTDEQINHHVQRLKKKGQPNNSRQLQHLLQNVSKNKSQSLLTSRISNV